MNNPESLYLAGLEPVDKELLYRYLILLTVNG
jgi:hypothetical protein